MARSPLGRKRGSLHRFHRRRTNTPVPGLSNVFLFALLVWLSVVANGCHSRQDPSEPVIQFTKVPRAGEGGPDKVESIGGRVLGSRSGQRIVLFARWGRWWVQPLVDEPFTTIQSDSTWKNTTHLGTHYAALLVEPGYHPAPQTDLLPAPGAGVIAVAITRGTPQFWQTWWFLLLATIALALLVLAFIRLRIRLLAKQMNVLFEERLAERTRIARELHDSLLQGFQGLLFRLQAVRQLLPEHPVDAAQALDVALDRGDQVIAEGRSTVEDLRASTLQNNDIVQALTALGEELALPSNGHAPVPLRVLVQGQQRDIDPILRDEVYRIAREALRNAFHHAEARNIEAELTYDDARFSLRVRDDGSGIDPNVFRDGRRSGHWGLPGMRERAGKFGGQLQVWTEPGAGTEIELTVPASLAYVGSSSRSAFRFFKSSFWRTHGRRP
jgi:signal transduction histidine kinase